MQTNRFIYRHPAPGCDGKTAVVEYTAAEWAASSFTLSQRASLDAGIAIQIGQFCVVDLVARYNLSCRHQLMTKAVA